MLNEECPLLIERLLALTSEADVQVSLYPKKVCIGDELVLDFDEEYQKSKNLIVDGETKASIEDLDNYLERHSGEGFAEMYLESSALYADPRWQEIRDLAAMVLGHMNVAYRRPVSTGAIYITE